MNESIAERIALLKRCATSLPRLHLWTTAHFRDGREIVRAISTVQTTLWVYVPNPKHAGVLASMHLIVDWRFTNTLVISQLDVLCTRGNDDFIYTTTDGTTSASSMKFHAGR
jgi:hypothetical protein